jgi:recombination protein RecA
MAEEKQEKAPVYPTTKAQKLAAVDLLGKTLDTQFKSKGTFQRLGKQVGQRIPAIATNLLSFDEYVLGCGGFPKGRVIEIFGPESAGKTAVTLHTIGCVQKSGGVAAFVDAEHALDPSFAAILGVNVDELTISQPNCGEQALDAVQALVESRAVDLIVVDSVAALVPQAELDGEFGDSHMGLQARLMSQAMRKLVMIIGKSNVTVIFINQIREKIGVVFGNPEVTTGGRGLKFAASVRVEVRRVATSKGGLKKDGDCVIGHVINFKAVKNKVGSPFRECQATIYYDNGFDEQDCARVYATELGILTYEKGWNQYYGKGDKIRSEDLKFEQMKGEIEKVLAKQRADAAAAQEAA